MNNEKTYSIADLEKISIDELSDDNIFVLDDKPRKFDELSGKFISPNDPKYNDLP